MTPRRLLDRSLPQRLMLLSLALLALFLLGQGASALGPEEKRALSAIRSGQRVLWQEMAAKGLTDPVHDPDKTGFIGLNWSATSTTLGSLPAKRNACDPLWGARTLRWFDSLGLRRGDRVLVLSSASFPGLLYAVLAAAEARGLDIDLVVSLGSSEWGANRPEAPWPVLAHILRGHGLLKTKARFYTLGGDNENGGGMPEEGVEALENAAREEGVPLVRAPGLEAVMEHKLALLEPLDRPRAKLVINIGGSHANLGRDEAVTSLRNGLLFPKEAPAAGDGVIARTLKQGVPVLHLLHLRSLARKAGIDYETRRPGFQSRSVPAALAGLALFSLVLGTHRRWSWEEEE